MAFSVSMEFGDQDGNEWEPVDLWVESGAPFTWVPREILEGLGVESHEDMAFELGNGELVHREIAETFVRYGDREHITIVVFAEGDERPILGHYTLTGFCLGVDVVNQQLVPVVPLAIGAR